MLISAQQKHHSQGKGNQPLNDFKDLVDAEHTRVVAPDYATAVRILQERFGSDWTVVHSRKVRRPGVLGWLGLSDVVVIVRTQKSNNDILTTPMQLENVIEEKIPVLAGDFSEEEMTTSPESEPVTMTSGDPVSSGVSEEFTEPQSEIFSSTDRNFNSGIGNDSPSENTGVNLSSGYSENNSSVVSGHSNTSGAKPEIVSPIPDTEVFNNLSARLEGSRQRIAEELKAFNSASPFHRAPDSWQSVDHGNVQQADEADVVGLSEIIAEAEKGQSAFEDPVFLGKVSKILNRCGFSDTACQDIKNAVRSTEIPKNLDDASLDSLIENRIGACVMERIPEAGGISLANTAGKTRFVALVGPTGVGKTTTLAKLAAYFHVVEKKKVGLITLDSYRLGAIEQLRRFADIIGLNFKTVNEPHQIQEEIAAFSKYDIVFVDTAGRSQKDVNRLKEVRDCLSSVNDLEVHLCLSLGAAPEALLATADAFRIVGYDHVILTKRDESYSKGFLWDLFGVMQKPVSYVTCGQEVPEDFDAASREEIRDMILGVE